MGIKDLVVRQTTRNRAGIVFAIGLILVAMAFFLKAHPEQRGVPRRGKR